MDGPIFFIVLKDYMMDFEYSRGPGLTPLEIAAQATFLHAVSGNVPEVMLGVTLITFLVMTGRDGPGGGRRARVAAEDRSALAAPRFQPAF